MGRARRSWTRAVAAMACAPGAILALAAGSNAPTRMSVATNGTEADSDSFECAISDDGATVVFRSHATNLAAGAPESGDHIFLRDLSGGTTSLVSADAEGAVFGGCYNPQISGDARYVLFQTYSAVQAPDEGGESDIYVLDRLKGLLRQVSFGRGRRLPDSHIYMDGAALSRDGRWAAVYSSASNLVKEEGGGEQVFLLDVKRRKFKLVSRSTNRAMGNGTSTRPSISPNGKFVVFESEATDLAPDSGGGGRQVFRWERKGRRIVHVSPAAGGGASGGESYAAAVADDGTVAFVSSAGDLLADADTDGGSTDVYLRDAATGVISSPTQGIDVSGGSGGRLSITADGGLLVFDATLPIDELDSGSGQDVYSWTRDSGTFRLVSRTGTGAGGNGTSNCYAQSLARDGPWVVYVTGASDITDGDGNGDLDVIRVDALE